MSKHRFYRMLLAGLVAALPAARGLWAGTIDYVMTGVTAQNTQGHVIRFTIDEHPTPDYSDAGFGLLGLYNVPVTVDGSPYGAFVWFGSPTSIYGPNSMQVSAGGLLFENNMGQAGNPMFSGSVSSPVMLPGTFHLDALNSNNYDQRFTVIATRTANAAPEPSTWALFGIGAGLLTLARRRVTG